MIMRRYWQVDFNLYGMGFIRLGKVLFRGALPATPLLPPRGWLHRTELHHPGQSGPGLFPPSCQQFFLRRMPRHIMVHHMSPVTCAHASNSRLFCSFRLRGSSGAGGHAADAVSRGVQPHLGRCHRAGRLAVGPADPEPEVRVWRFALFKQYAVQVCRSYTTQCHHGLLHDKPFRDRSIRS